jgi:hypothetical protein
MAVVVGFAGCVAETPVEVTFELPEGAPPIDGESVRIVIGEQTGDGFRVLRGGGGSAAADPRSFDLAVPEGDDRIARVVIYEGDLKPLFHGQSDPFSVTSSSEPAQVNVKLVPPPEGTIVRTIPGDGEVVIEMQARRWSAIRLGLLPQQPTHEATREEGDAESDMPERVSVTYPLDMVECTLERGCPLTLFVDFLSRDGVFGPTATATLTVDVVPPALGTRARLEGGEALGAGSRLIVTVEASEPVEDVGLSLARRILRAGDCAELLGPYACTGLDRKFTCSVSAPDEACDASYTVGVVARDRLGNTAQVFGADITVDSLPPDLVIGGTICTAGVMVVAGTTVDATEVALRDATGNTLAAAAEGSFTLAASASVAASLVAIDGGGNERSLPVACPE